MAYSLRSGKKYNASNDNTDGKQKSEIKNDNRLYPDLTQNTDIYEDDYEIVENEDVDEREETANESIDYKRLNQFLANSANRDIDDQQSTSRTCRQRTNQSNDSKCFKFVVFVILPMIALISSFILFNGNKYHSYFSTQPQQSLKNEWLLFENEFNAIIETKYNKVLPDLGFKVMKRAVRSVMNSSRLDPAVILLISSVKQTHIINCLENDFVSAISNAYNEKNIIKINGKQTNTNDIIEKFDQSFNSSDKKHTIVVENLESIPTEDIMALHQFTDHESAKYTRSIIILTATYYKEINLSKNAGLRSMDEIASQLLDMSWKNGMADEQRSALISRLTPSVVTVLDITDNQVKC